MAKFPSPIQSKRFLRDHMDRLDTNLSSDDYGFYIKVDAECGIKDAKRLLKWLTRAVEYMEKSKVP